MEIYCKKAGLGEFINNENTVLIIDEIQESKEVYNAIRDLRERCSCDIIVSGSYLARTVNSKDFFEKKPRAVTISDEGVQHITEIYRNREVIEGVSNTITKETAAEKGYNLCTTQYVTLKASEGIVVEDNTKYIENYEKLQQRLENIDKELDEVRSRFVKEA